LKSVKRVATWLVCEEEKGFNGIERNADILASLSVFGNLPREFIDRCHKLQGIRSSFYTAPGG
jgi:hypothetical protein